LPEAADAGINALIQDDPDLAEGCAIRCSIPGIAEVRGAMLLIEMPELCALDEKQVAPRKHFRANRQRLAARKMRSTKISTGLAPIALQ
jgi:hypothetical protein